jgi:hypothetical protein
MLRAQEKIEERGQFHRKYEIHTCIRHIMYMDSVL